MNFELFDNLFQVGVLGMFSLISGISAIRYKNRCCLILAFAYACFAMGTLYYAMYLAIIGRVPQVFYVAEISWLASYLFLLALQIVRLQSRSLRFSWIAAGGALCMVIGICIAQIFGPSLLMIALFALTAGGVTYLTIFHMRSGAGSWQTDICILVCLVLQVALYLVSGAIRDYTDFNAYFVVDMLLTTSMAALMPLVLREVSDK